MEKRGHIESDLGSDEEEEEEEKEEEDERDFRRLATLTPQNREERGIEDHRRSRGQFSSRATFQRSRKRNNQGGSPDHE